MKSYEKYAAEVPDEVVKIITALDDPVRRAILILLNKHNEISFSDIQRELDVSKLILNYHLKNLYSVGLVDHYFRHELGNQKYSYYTMTSLGKRVLNNIVEMLIPPLVYSARKEQKVVLKKAT